MIPHYSRIVPAVSRGHPVRFFSSPEGEDGEVLSREGIRPSGVFPLTAPRIFAWVRLERRQAEKWRPARQTVTTIASPPSPRQAVSRGPSFGCGCVYSDVSNAGGDRVKPKKWTPANRLPG